jgi:hypothetical protein
VTLQDEISADEEPEALYHEYVSEKILQVKNKLALMGQQEQKCFIQLLCNGKIWLRM